MKKRILALILCLVMAVSLLPITAAAYNLNSVTIQASGVEWGSDGYSDGYNLKITNWILDDNGNILNKDTFQGSFQGGSLFTDASCFDRLTVPPEEGGVYYTTFYLKHDYNYFDRNPNFTVTLEIPGYETECSIRDAGGGYLQLSSRLTKEANEHTWLFDHQGNSLTAKCSDPNCPIGTVGVTLTAHSVTLPDSPFNAQVETTGAFKEAFPNAQIYGPYYLYNDESKGFIEVDPKTFTPKAGEYQAQVYIYGLFGNEVAEYGAFGMDDDISQGGSFTSLWVDYTAVDPTITAQTGDSRPIELMMAGMAVFSVLAAAAFALDSKRKYRQ